MIGFGAIPKAMFFDRKAVRSYMARREADVLRKFGASVRLTAKHSIRKRKAVSAPGKPPSSHAGHLRRMIFFAYDPVRRSVVIGPLRFRRGEAPSLLEYGGTVTRKRRGKRRRMKYKPRPFMARAFEKEKPKLPAMWARSVKR